jgi:hypothetical protein
MCILGLLNDNTYFKLKNYLKWKNYIQQVLKFREVEMDT